MTALVGHLLLDLARRGVALAILVSAFSACQSPGGDTAATGQTPAADAVNRRFKVAVARFQHETCTFCPGGDMGIEDWTRIRQPFGGDELLGDEDTYVAGFVKMAREFGDLDLVGLTSPYEAFGGSSRAWTTKAAFDHFVTLMLTDLKAAMPVDGVYLALHGAMAVRDVPRPEAEIARRFRDVVGPNVPIVAAFDLHGNEDEQFLQVAEGSFVTKHFPHYDSWHQGERAAIYLRRIMRGEYRPVRVTRTVPVVTATVLQWTGASPVMDIMARAALGGSVSECVRERVPGVPVVGRAGYRHHGAGHDQRRPGPG